MFECSACSGAAAYQHPCPSGPASLRPSGASSLGGRLRKHTAASRNHSTCVNGFSLVWPGRVKVICNTLPKTAVDLSLRCLPAVASCSPNLAHIQIGVAAPFNSGPYPPSLTSHCRIALPFCPPPPLHTLISLSSLCCAKSCTTKNCTYKKCTYKNCTYKKCTSRSRI